MTIALTVAITVAAILAAALAYARHQARNAARLHESDIVRATAQAMVAAMRQEVADLERHREACATTVRAQIAEAEVRARMAERRAADTVTALEAATTLVRELRQTLDGRASTASPRADELPAAPEPTGESPRTTILDIGESPRPTEWAGRRVSDAQPASGTVRRRPQDEPDANAANDGAPA